MQNNNKLKVVRSALNVFVYFYYVGLYKLFLQKVNSAKLSSAKEQLCRKQTLHVIVLLVKKSSVDSKQLVKNNMLFLDKSTSSCYRSSGLQCMVTSTYRHAQLIVTTAGGSRRVQQLKRLSRMKRNLQELTNICWQDIHHSRGHYCHNSDVQTAQ